MIVGVDIGGTYTDVVAYDGSEFKHVSTIESKKITKEFIEEVTRKADAVGIGIAAWIKGNKIVKAPNLKIVPELDFEKYFIENDANCFAFYSSKILNAKNLLAITVGTGIGTGIVIDGKIYRGSGLAGEIGHTFAFHRRVCSCGKVGHLEAIFGGKYIDTRFLLKSGKIYKTLGFKYFCKAIAFSVMLLDPEFVVIGGRVGGRLNEKLIEEEVKKFTAEEFEFKVVCIQDDLAVAKGAALLATSKTHRRG
ncbi:MAG: ROK family protein [Archaeoglobaceae archaeon]|nr:ROK family protein [Archaeoglobaceae archaeon]MCX8152293.1 ROK family protein [Archaeoglobaceae archaeon]MDW8013971.1 ROK family protein [Archaeoglobaceae archaeon]